MERVAIESRRFGRIEAKPSDLIHFEGLPGFPGARTFLLLAHDRDSPFSWLVCVQEPELAFVVTDPWQFFPSYEPELEACHLRSVQAERRTELDLMVIASVRDGEIHVNLAAPLVVNRANRRAAQAILTRGDHSPRTPIRPKAEHAPPAASGGKPHEKSGHG